MARRGIALVGWLCLAATGGPAGAAELRVLINEVHYHPGDDSRFGEFVELHNHGRETVDLSGWLLSGGVEHVFPPGTRIPAGGYLLVVHSRAVLESRYVLDPAIISGEFSGSLSNNGELLRLSTSRGYLVSFVEYSDSEPWPEICDGLGPSLERVSPLLEEADHGTWEASILVGGTPGEPNSVFRKIEPPPTPPPGGEGDVVVPRGATWRFRRGFSEPSPSWTDVGFNDQGWEEGPAGFGYDDGDDTTILRDMQGRYTTVYVRRRFSIEDPASVRSLVFHVLFDDGYVAYLNGTEIARENAPGAPGTRLPFDAEASSTIGPAPTRQVDVSAFRSLLVPGENVLAVQGLNSFIDSRDFSLHPWLSGSFRRVTTDRLFVATGAEWRFFRGTEATPADWATSGFADGGWEIGNAGFGYGDGDDTTLIDDMQGSYVSLYIRTSFDVEDPRQLVGLTLTVDYDDGFVAFLNGSEVARANVDASSFDDTALGSHEAGTPETFTLTTGSLVAGRNVIALQGHNGSLGSTDFSLSPALSGELRRPDPPPPEEPPDVRRPPRDLVINEFFPGGAASGWVELFNPTSAEIDASGRRIHGFPAALGEHTLPAGSRVAPGGFLVVREPQLGFELEVLPVCILSTDDGRFIDALNPRTTAPGHSTGRFPDGRDNRQVYDAPTPGTSNPALPEGPIVINEIMYRAADDNPADEYVELFNSSGEAVDLTGWNFTRGISYSFPSETSLSPGGFLVIAANPAAVEARYGITGVLGPYTGRLSNDAETLLLRDDLRNTADRVRFADEGSWPEEPDGGGPSLELLHPARRRASSSMERPASWKTA